MGTIRQAVIDEINVDARLYASGAIDKALTYYQLAADDDYDAASDELINKAALKVLKTISITSIAEGDYAKKIELENRIARMEIEYGMVEAPKEKSLKFRSW